MASGFIFRRMDSPIHRLDPRVKLLMSIELFSLSLLGRTVPELSATIAVVLFVSFAAGVLRRLGRTLVFSAGFAGFIFVINYLLGFSLLESFVLALRFVSIVGSTSVFFLTTSPDELEYVMKWFHLPRDVVFAFVTAVRFVPVLMLDAMQIMDAQKSRGLEMEKGNIMARIKNFTPVLVPLVVSAVMRSGELAEAMEARGYGASDRPTSLYTLAFKTGDWLVSFGSVSLFVFAVYFFWFVM